MVEVRLARTLEEIQAGISFYQDFYQRQFNTYPKLKGSLMIAYNYHDKICGTVSLSRADDVDHFEIEEYFDLDLNLVSISRETCVELSRLAGVGIGKILLLVAYHYALNNRANRIIACLKPSLLACIQKRWHLPCIIIPSRMRTKSIPAEYANYFLQKPKPMVASSEQLPGEWEKQMKESSSLYNFSFD